MRLASSRVVTLWITVLCLLAALFSLNSLAAAQAAHGSKHKLSQQGLHQTPLAGSLAVARAAKPNAPPPVTTDTWTGGASGNWSVAGNWNNGAITSGENILINLTTAATNVDANFSIGTLTLSNAGDSANINNNIQLTVGGNITNNGTISLNSSNNTTELIVGASAITLSGTGTLTMSNNPNNFIIGSATADTLTNSSTIQGSGNIGDNQMTLVNSGTIDATQPNALFIDANGGTTNTGTLEATTGSLILYGNSGTTTITQTGAGTIKSTGSDVQLQSGITINGGTLTTSGTGLIHTIGGQSATLENLTNAGNYQVDNNATTNLVGTITNNGNINLASSNNLTDLVASGNVSLAGTGTITLSNNPSNYIYGTTSGATLTIGSGQTVSGSGDIGYDPFVPAPQLTLVNNGVIDATQSNFLYIQTSGGTTNTGTLEATTGTLILYGNTFTQTGAGKISATGSDVQLQNGVTIIGGTLTTSGTGLIHTVSGHTGTLENLTNTGNYQVDNNSTTDLIGTVTNNGNINLASTNNSTELVMNGNATLNGTGTVTMSNNANNLILGAVATDVFTVGSGQTVSGAGDIGFNQMALVNNGVIDANQPNALFIDTSNGTTNNKTLEATNAGTLILFGRNDNSVPNTIVNTSGTITAANASVVDLEAGIIISGGTLTTAGTGLIHTLSGSSATLENLTNAGNYQVDNNATTVLLGTIVNNGNINLASVNNATEIQISGNVTLNGTGTLTMSNNANNLIFGQTEGGTEVLTNNINISGAGNIGDGFMILNNTSLGTINANQSNTLTIAPTPSSTAGVTNTGLMEATAGGTLGLNNGTYVNAVGSTQGTILANGGTVNLNNGATIVGGKLQSENGSAIQITSNATLDGSTSTGAVTVVAGSSLNVLNNTALNVKGSIVNNGTLSLLSSNSATELEVNGTSATLSGTGTVSMSNNPNNFIFGAAGSDTLINQETIQGSGQIGDNQLTFVNNGTVNANQSNQLFINASGGTTNTGTLEATAGGTLSLTGYTITNTGATIQANGVTGVGGGATVNLESGVTITGGTLSSNQFGSFNELNSATLNGVTSNATVNVENNTLLNLQGTIVNNGTLNLQSSNNATELILSGNVTLNGTGTVTMSNNINNFIFGAAGTDVLTVAGTQTIQGAGFIGDNQMVLVNNGTIDANVSNSLTLNASGGTTNTKTIEATSGGTLNLNGDVVTNTGAGTIVAGSGSTVNLENGVTVVGGSLTGTGNFVELNSATLSGLTNASTVIVNNNTTMLLTGTIVNNGQIQENSSNNTTEIQLTGNVTLNGTGTLVMSNNPNNYIFGLSGNDVLTNASTIEGSGHLGDDQMSLVNSGTILANQSNTLAIFVSGTVNNTGTFEATSSGGLTVTAPVAGFLNYTSTNNTLTGGTYIANGGNITLPLGTSGGIATLAANVTEENGGQILNGNNGNANALNGLTSITSAGALTIGGVTFVDAGSFSNAGSLTILAGESFTVGSLAQISGGSLTAGTYVLDANLNLSGTAQTITTNATNLTLAGGTIHNNTGGTNALAGLAFNTKNLTIGGSSNNVSTTAASFSNTGTLTINGSDSFTAGNLTQIASGTLSAGTYVLGGNLDLTTSGISITKNSATLTLQGGTINSNNVNALSALAFNTSKLTIAGSSNNVSTSAASFSNTGTLTINSGDSFTATTLTQLTGANNNKTLTAGTYVLGGNLDLTTAGLTITKNSATLTLQGGTINSNNVNALGALATNTGKLTIAGTGNNVSTTAASFSNTGTLTINAGDSFIAPALTQISGSTLTAGTFVLGGNLDLAATANITTNSANLTLEGGTIQTGSTNDLANLNSNTNALTLASNANFTAVGNFTNSGALTVNKGSKFSLTGTHTLTNLSAGTLGSGTYTIGGTLQLTTANGGITTNAANLTLTGTGFSIKDGTANALAGFNNNTGTFALASGANFTTGGNFTDSGTATIAKGTKLTIGGTNNTYTQSAGTTNLDGTLAGGNATVTGGLFQGAGTVSKNLTIGGGGTAPTLNVGDAGKTGLLAITGTYTQLSTGTMTGLINGTTAGTGFSQLNVTGTAALAGTINFTVAAGFQGSLFLGETFTVLNAASITGSFSNSTIAINSSFHFTVTYTSTGVVLTVASGPVSGPSSSPAQPVAQMAMVTPKPAANQSKTPVVTGGLSQRTSVVRSSKIAKPIFTAVMGHSNAIIARSSEISGLRSWEHLPVNPIAAKPITVARIATPVNSNLEHNNIVTGNRWVGGSQAIAVHAPLAGSMANYHRVPVKTMPLSPPRMVR
jgi:hypothetical protein